MSIPDPVRIRQSGRAGKGYYTLAHEFIQQFSFSTVIDVTRRELEAMRQGAYETATSFISHWREKVIQMIE